MIETVKVDLNLKKKEDATVQKILEENKCLKKENDKLITEIDRMNRLVLDFKEFKDKAEEARKEGLEL